MSDDKRAALIEDNLMFGATLESGLKREGFAVRLVPNGKVAVQSILEWQPQLCLVNLASRGFSGAELIKEIRAAEGRAGLKIIGYAGHVEADLLRAGRAAGANLVAPNSAMRSSLAEVLLKLQSADSDAP